MRKFERWWERNQERNQGSAGANPAVPRAHLPRPRARIPVQRSPLRGCWLRGARARPIFGRAQHRSQAEQREPARGSPALFASTALLGLRSRVHGTGQTACREGARAPLLSPKSPEERRAKDFAFVVFKGSPSAPFRPISCVARVSTRPRHSSREYIGTLIDTSTSPVPEGIAGPESLFWRSRGRHETRRWGPGRRTDAGGDDRLLCGAGLDLCGGGAL